jgi:hypothetical protein
MRYPRWLVIALVVVVVAIAAIYMFGGRPTGINYYRVSGDRTIQVGVVSGVDTWTRVEVDETPSAVTVRVYSYQLPGNRAGVGFYIELAIVLDEPLGERPVIDGRDGGIVDLRGFIPL